MHLRKHKKTSRLKETIRKYEHKHKAVFALVFYEPECTPHELSEYEKLRKARIETNQEFLRGLGLARGGYSGVCGC